MSLFSIPEWARNATKMMRSEPFITSTGIAAFVHSTWALAVMFSGQPPPITDFVTLLQWALLVLPAALIAFSVDVGQIVTSSQLRNGQRNRAKYATFFLLAAATFYLQWLYMIHHVPALELGAGVRGDWAAGIATIRDASVWIVPALLPLATLLYTFSHGGTTEQRDVTELPAKTGKGKRARWNIKTLPMIRNHAQTQTLPNSSNGNGHKSREQA